MAKRTILQPLLLLLFTGHAVADDVEIGRALKAKGVDVVEAKGIVAAVTVKDGSKLTDSDFQQITRLAHLQTLSLSSCLDDKRLSQLTVLGELERLATNGAQITDDGLKPLAQLKNLRTLAFFHPGKAFSGEGLVHLSKLPHFEGLTVAGSPAFNDLGMAAVARLAGLKEFRTWHAGGTDEGVKRLQSLKNLTSLWLGQRLTHKPPACPTDETVAILAEMKSLGSLQLDEARLTYAALLQLKRLPALRRLTLGGIDISQRDVEQLRQQWPQVKIGWTPPSDAYQKRIRALFGGN